MKLKNIIFLLLILLGLLKPILAQDSSGTIIIPEENGRSDEDLVELSFKNVEIRNLLNVISQASGKSFLFQERDLVNRKITLISNEKYTIAEAYKIFERILSVNGLQLIEEKNGIIRVVNVNTAKGQLTVVATPENRDEFISDSVVTRIIKVNNTNINTLFSTINPFLSKTGIIKIYTATNSFIVKDSLDNTDKIAELVALLDKDDDYIVKRFVLKNISVAKFKLVLDKVITKKTTTGASNFFSYDNESNTVIAIARNNEIKKIENLVKELDINVADNGNNDFILEVIPIQYLKLADALKFIRNVFNAGAPSKSGIISIGNSNIIQLEDANSFLIYGPKETIDKVKFYVSEVDQEASNIILEVVPLLHSDANTASKLVAQIFQNRIVSGSPLKLKTFVEGETNSLILLGTDTTINKVKTFLQKFDKPRTVANSQGFKFYFYPVQNANASNIASILSTISGNITKQAVTISVPDDTNTTTTTTTTKATNAKTTSKTKQATTTPKTTASASTTTTTQEQLSIIADVETNSLIIYANQSQYNIIKNAIEDLDVIRPQVFVEALIVEINVEKNLNLGVNFSRSVTNPAGNSGFNITSPGGVDSRPVPQTQAEVLASGGTGALLGILGPTVSLGGIEYASYSAFVQALATDTDVNILSNPKILTLNNKKASISVGENRPFLTSTATDSNGVVTPNYEYRDIGVLLDILPQINAGDYVNMEIKQENTSALDENSTLPRTLKRTITTQVVIKSGQTVALGGLIQDQKTLTENKVPCLGDIPFLGYLFKSTLETSRKTNLVVFITPTIVRTTEEQRAINKKAANQTKQNFETLRIEIEKNINNILIEDGELEDEK